MSKNDNNHNPENKVPYDPKTFNDLFDSLSPIFAKMSDGSDPSSDPEKNLSDAERAELKDKTMYMDAMLYSRLAPSANPSSPQSLAEQMLFSILSSTEGHQDGDLNEVSDPLLETFVGAVNAGTLDVPPFLQDYLRSVQETRAQKQQMDTNKDSVETDTNKDSIERNSSNRSQNKNKNKNKQSI